MIVTIVGIGLIGGSLGLALKESGFATKVIGVDKNFSNANKALVLEIIDEISDLDQAIAKSDLIILAIPVDVTDKLLPTILDKVQAHTVVTDMGSSKSVISKTVENHLNRKNFVASHPIAGTEHSGPLAAFKELFAGKVAIICDREKSSLKSLHVVETMYKHLRMKLVYMDSEAHDLHVAYVSHLSHITSFALGLTVLDKEKDEATIFNLAGSGFESTVRLAKSSPEMWNPIFEQNAKNISTGLGEYIEKLQEFKNLLDKNNWEEIYNFMKASNEIKRVLNDMKYKN